MNALHCYRSAIRPAGSWFVAPIWRCVFRLIRLLRGALFDSRSYAPVEAYGVMFDLIVRPWRG